MNQSGIVIYAQLKPSMYGSFKRSHRFSYQSISEWIRTIEMRSRGRQKKGLHGRKQ